MSICHGLSAALLAAVIGNVQASTIDGEPTSGRVTPLTVPSYRVILQAAPECKGEGPLKVCNTIRILEVLETEYPTDPVVWKEVPDAREGHTDDPNAGVMQVTVFKPSYTGRSDLFRMYVEATTCSEPAIVKCVTTWSKVEGIKPTARAPE